jgi:hypothetical protein
MKANSTKQENTIRTGGKSISKQMCGSEGALIPIPFSGFGLGTGRPKSRQKGGITKLLPPKVI